MYTPKFYDGEFVLEDYVASNLDFPVVTQQCKEIFEKFSIGETEMPNRAFAVEWEKSNSLRLWNEGNSISIDSHPRLWE